MSKLNLRDALIQRGKIQIIVNVIAAPTYENPDELDVAIQTLSTCSDNNVLVAALLDMARQGIENPMGKTLCGCQACREERQREAVEIALNAASDAISNMRKP